MTSATPTRWQPLTGGPIVWIFMAVEVITFGMFMIWHAWSARAAPALFAESQALLHPDSATVGTVLLLLGSGAAYLAALNAEARQHRHAAIWLGGGALMGAAFCVNKIAEYQSPELAHITLSTNGFWFSYLFLTLLHLLHVAGGVIAFLWLGAQQWRGGGGEDDTLGVQAGAVYWHLVDVIWLLLFPTLYLMHP